MGQQIELLKGEIREKDTSIIKEHMELDKVGRIFFRAIFAIKTNILAKNLTARTSKVTSEWQVAVVSVRASVCSEMLPTIFQKSDFGNLWETPKKTSFHHCGILF